MISVYVELSSENGFVLAVFNEGEEEPIYGVTIPTIGLDDEIANGIRYKISLDSFVRVEELHDDTVKEVTDKSGITFVSPFDEEEKEQYDNRRRGERW